MKINLDQFSSYEEFGYIKKQIHPSLDLVLWSYTEKAGEDDLWLPETLIANGLITDSDGNVIERPFHKFFTFEEYVDFMGGLIPEKIPEITEKIDGELGILYKSKDQWAIATKDSFGSEQACFATKILREKYPRFKPDERYTYLFEIINPEKKNVVEYGLGGLIFIAAINKETGLQEKIRVPEFPMALRHHYPSMEAMFSEKRTENREGFVMFYPEENLRLKVKFQSYIDKLNESDDKD